MVIYFITLFKVRSQPANTLLNFQGSIPFQDWNQWVTATKVAFQHDIPISLFLPFLYTFRMRSLLSFSFYDFHLVSINISFDYRGSGHDQQSQKLGFLDKET